MTAKMRKLKMPNNQKIMTELSLHIGHCAKAGPPSQQATMCNVKKSYFFKHVPCDYQLNSICVFAN